MGGRITALRVQKRNKERVNVYLDGEFAFGLTALEAMHLRVGQELSDEEIARLRSRDLVEQAHQRALNFLSYRPRSAAEVRTYLQRKGTPPEAIEEVIARLERVGLIDDVAFARFWLENRETFRPRGKHGLRYELRQKGIAPAIIEEILADYDEEAAAYRVALARARRLPRDDARVFRKRLYDYLARRGFDYEVIQTVVTQVEAELADETISTRRGHEE
ncbi:MAG: hypothetical protein D6759_16165 [Chloroflexi bacterium]|nr:MAG: hypothetical protein D6759_16165 [Chloroflexota bacterium]